LTKARVIRRRNIFLWKEIQGFKVDTSESGKKKL
jgi:hypothetical protein